MDTADVTQQTIAMGEDMRTFWAVVPATHVSRLPGLKRDSIQINMSDVDMRFQLVSAGK